MNWPNACGFLVCKKTVPGPVNLQTRPSPDAMPEMIPPDAMRSITYFVFQATKWPLSIMYRSPSCNCGLISVVLRQASPAWMNKKGDKVEAYIFADNGTETGNPHNSRSRDLVDIQSLTREDRLSKTLTLVVSDDTLC